MEAKVGIESCDSTATTQVPKIQTGETEGERESTKKHENFDINFISLTVKLRIKPPRDSKANFFANNETQNGDATTKYIRKSKNIHSERNMRERNRQLPSQQRSNNIRRTPVKRILCNVLKTNHTLKIRIESRHTSRCHVLIEMCLLLFRHPEYCDCTWRMKS